MGVPRWVFFVVGWTMLQPPGALAQEGKQEIKEKEAELAGGPRTQKYEEVERGFWLRGLFSLSLPVTNLYESGDSHRETSTWPLSSGTGLEMGFDIGRIAEMHLELAAVQLSGTRNVSATSSNTLRNDATGFLIMVGGRFDLATTKRTAWFLKANAGYSLGFPSAAELKDGVVVEGGFGLEYATFLRHFFLGLELGGQYWVASGGVLLFVTPLVKYTF